MSNVRAKTRKKLKIAASAKNVFPGSIDLVVLWAPTRVTSSLPSGEAAARARPDVRLQVGSCVTQFTTLVGG
jgi:hypothetical protein